MAVGDLASSWSFAAACLCVVVVSSTLLYCYRRRRRGVGRGAVSSSYGDKGRSCPEDTNSTSEETENDSPSDAALKLQSSLLAMSLGGLCDSTTSPTSSPRNGSWLRSIESSRFLPHSLPDSTSPSDSPPLTPTPPVAVATSGKSLLKPSKLTKLPGHSNPVHGPDRDVFKLMNGLSLTRPASDHSSPLTWQETSSRSDFSKRQLRIRSHNGSSKNQVYCNGNIDSSKNLVYRNGNHASRYIGGEDSFKRRKCGGGGGVLILCLLASLATNAVLLFMYLQR